MQDNNMLYLISSEKYYLNVNIKGAVQPIYCV